MVLYTSYWRNTMIKDKGKQKNYSSEKWLHYQNVEVLTITVKPTKEDQEKIKKFNEFIKNKQDNKKNSTNN